MKFRAPSAVAVVRRAVASCRHGMRNAAAFLALALLFALPAVAQVTIPPGATVNEGDITYENKDVVINGGTVTINGHHDFNSLNLKSGTITCAKFGDADYRNGLDLTIKTDCAIAAGSEMNADNKGYGSDDGPGKGTQNVNSRGGGGAYGGEGSYRYLSEGIGGTVYGSIQNPSEPGSGGGTGNGNAGGRGGGLIHLNVTGTLTLNGSLSAVGQSNPSGNGGAGSGGAINLVVGTIAGNGSAYANGGNSVYPNNAGAGGGGRISVSYNFKTFSGTIQAAGGVTQNTWSGAGTVFLKGPGAQFGDLIVDNGGHETSDDASSGDGPDQLGVALTKAETFDNVTIRFGGCLVPPTGKLLRLHVVKNLTVEGTGRIRAGGRGFGASIGPGAGTIIVNGRGIGGAYGGEGMYRYLGEGKNSALYGNLRDPNGSDMEAAGMHFGSGGGYGNNGIDLGGRGGGGLRIVVDGVLTDDGVISASGSSNPSSNGGAGSGGSVYLIVGTLAGSGVVVASGGNSTYPNNGGAGAGGRIAIYYSAKTFSGAILSPGGVSQNAWAGPGTVFLKGPGQMYGDLIVDNGGNWTGNRTATSPAALLMGEETFDNVTIQGQGLLAPSPMHRFLLNVTGDMNVLSGAVNVDGLGYATEKGPIGQGGVTLGAGTPSGIGYSSGASYGGTGDFGTNNLAPGKTYGSPDLANDPLDQLFGSGGAYGNGDPVGHAGGAGGGAMYLRVNGILRVNAYLLARGLNSLGSRGSGGSGGSILIRAGVLTGSGEIHAYGDGSNRGDGRSGAGRVAIYAATNTFPDASILLESGAHKGTLFKQKTNGNLTLSASLDKTTLVNGRSAQGQVTLDGPAPTGGLTIEVTNSDSGALSAPVSVFVPEGAMTAPFTITANGVGADRTVNLGLRLWDQVVTQKILVQPYLSRVTLLPASVNGGQTTKATVVLNDLAPPDGLTIALAADDPAVTVPSTVTVPGSAKTVTFTISAGAVSVTKKVKITLLYKRDQDTGPGETKAATLIVNPGGLQIASVYCTPGSAVGGQRVTGVVTLNGKAPVGGVEVALTSSDPVASVPFSVVVKEGKSSVSFPITTARDVQDDHQVLINAQCGGSVKGFTLNVGPPKIGDLVLYPSTLVGGDTSVGIITLKSPTPVPVTITVTSDNDAAIIDTDDGNPGASKTMTIAAGQQIGTFFIVTTAVPATTRAAIVVSANKSAKTRILTITP